MTLHNAHVLKWYRWKIWLAEQMRKPMRMTFFIQWHNDELAKNDLIEQQQPARARELQKEVTE